LTYFSASDILIQGDVSITAIVNTKLFPAASKLHLISMGSRIVSSKRH